MGWRDGSRCTRRLGAGRGGWGGASGRYIGAMGTERFDRHPYVCGTIGVVDPEDLVRLVAASPPTRVLVAEPHFMLRGHGKVEALTPPGRGWVWGGLVPGEPGDDPVESRLCAGAFHGSDAWSLTADTLGLQHLYRRPSRTGFLFASRIEPLVRAHPGRVHADWDAWSTILTLGSPLGPATPFVEVRRWVAGESVSVGRDGRVGVSVADPSWLAEGRPAATAAEIVDTLLRALPELSWWRRRPVIPLSGGWDSRLLAAAARRKYGKGVYGATTTIDVGHERDLDLAPAVAAGLDMRHRVVVPEPGAWIDDATETRERVEYQTWYHPWFMSLARDLHRSRRPALSGFCGGVFLKGHMVDEQVLAAPDWDDRSRLLFGRFGHTREWMSSPLVTPRGRAVAEHALERWRAAADRFADHRSGLTLAYLFLRGAPALGPMATQLLAPELDVVTPYVAPRFMSAAMSVPQHEKLDGAFVLRVLDAASPEVSRLPSTNDHLPGRPRLVQRQGSAEARAWMAGRVRSSPVARSLASPRLMRRALDGSDAGTRRWGIPAGRILLSLSLLAQWQERYDDVLDPGDDPGWSAS
jgi:hypothetical protein